MHRRAPHAGRLALGTRRVWLVLGIVAAVAVGAVLLLTEPAGSLDQTACDGDGPEGYACTALLNKGGGEVIGEQFFRRRGEDAEELEILTHLFDEPSTGHTEEKLCVDDDNDPLTDQGSCTGGSAGTKVDAGDPLPDPDDGEEDDGEYEVLIQSFDAVGTVTVDGEELAQYVVAVDGYELASFHFNQGDLSVESFFEAPLPPDLAVSKTPDDGVVDPGEAASFTIAVENAGPGAAEGVTLEDSLPGDLAWREDPDVDGCEISDGTELSCEFGELDAGETASVTVSADTTSANCGVLDNTATASADNHEPVSDSGAIEVRCGAIAITKTAKHADDSGETEPDLSAGFTITDASGAEVASVTTDANGEACVDGLAHDTYTVAETDVPAGYTAPDPKTVELDTTGSCEEGAEAVTFTNVPLTDVSVSVGPRVDGATETVLACWEGSASGEPDHTATVTDGSLDVAGLTPTDPDVTLTCEITVDP